MDFKPIRNADVHPYVVKAGQTIAPGDPVCLDASARTVVKWGDTETKFVLGVAASGVTSAVAGDKIMVYDNPDCVFMATADASIAQTTVNIACDVIGTSGDNFLVDIGTTTTAQWKVVDLLQNVDPLTATAKPRGVLVKPVKHVYAAS